MENNYNDLWNKSLPRGGADAITGFRDPTKILKLPVRAISPSEVEGEVLRVSNDFIEKMEDAKDSNDSSVVGTITVNRNYFVPAVEDICVGYECEVNTSVLPGLSEGWQKINFNSWSTIYHHSKYAKNIFRTPYLTPDQIIAEGWKKIDDFLPPFRHVFTKDNYFLVFDRRKPHIEIIAVDVTKIDWLPERPEIFRITIPCPSINEFRKICKLIKI